MVGHGGDDAAARPAEQPGQAHRAVGRARDHPEGAPRLEQLRIVTSPVTQYADILGLLSPDLKHHAPRWTGAVRDEDGLGGRVVGRDPAAVAQGREGAQEGEGQRGRPLVRQGLQCENGCKVGRVERGSGVVI